MTDATTHEGIGTDLRPLRLNVTVNNHPVVLTERRMTGLEIKQAAIAQGAAIEVGFQLSVKKGNHYEVVGDDDPITIHKDQEFLAVAPDDNS
jgi:hypothetical protein